MNYRILLVEDEEHIAEGIKVNLEMEGYHVTVARSGKQAIMCFKKERFSLIILDIMLPEIDGFMVCETIRLENRDIPILILTAKSLGSDKVFGLKKGADDYLTKPFNLEELLLRVRNLIHRSIFNARVSFSYDVYTFGGNTINFSTFEIMGIKGKKMHLSKKEIMILKLLIERQNEVVSREKILETVWGYSVYPSTRTIDNYILSFRKYFEKDSGKPRHFISIRGVGYKFVE